MGVAVRCPTSRPLSPARRNQRDAARRRHAGPAHHFHGDRPLLAAGMKVDLPQAQAAQPLNPKEPLVVIVGSDGKLALGDETIDPADLVQLVRAINMGDDFRSHRAFARRQGGSLTARSSR